MACSASQKKGGLSPHLLVCGVFQAAAGSATGVLVGRPA